MKKIQIVKIESLSREPLVIEGYFFEGKNKDAKSAVIIGAMEGQAILPLFCCAKLIKFMKKCESENLIEGDILVIPSINHYALNIAKRFWPLDNTDINMMFPGYELGETTQRIAKKVFDVVSKYDYAISLERRPDPADCLPYIKLYKSGYEDIEDAKKFGFKFIHHRNMKSIDTVSLQYNLQLWESKSFSIMCPTDSKVDTLLAKQINQGIIRFLSRNDVIEYNIFNGYESNIITRENIEVVKTPKSGIYISFVKPASYVAKDEVIGEIVDSLEGEVIHQFKSTCNGMITCTYNSSLIYENAVAFRIAKVGR